MSINLSQIQVHPSQGLKTTLAQMEFLKNKAVNNPQFVTWVYQQFSSKCISCVPGRLWKYMRQYFKFENDDPHDEILIAPYLMPDLRRGDCDDFSLFAKTCLDILGGFNARYMLLGVNRNEWTHIVVYCDRGYDGNVIDPVIIDGANSQFNVVPNKYNWYKVL